MPNNILHLCTMARIMAFDYGTKRTGIAVTDSMQIIATGLSTQHSKDLISFIKSYLVKEPVECFVVGEPRRLNNTNTQATAPAEAFVNLLRKNFPSIPVHRIDERFTSKIAFQAIIDSGVKKKDRQDRALVDEVSATVILQSFMESRDLRK